MNLREYGEYRVRQEMLGWECFSNTVHVFKFQNKNLFKNILPIE